MEDVALCYMTQDTEVKTVRMPEAAHRKTTNNWMRAFNPKSLLNNGIQPYLPVCAPISGFVTNLNANVGKYLDAGDPLCDVINKSQPLIQLTVYEKELALMCVGKLMEFRVNGMGKETFRAQIVSIDQSVDEKVYSIKVYAKVTSLKADFRPGMYVRAKLK